jgi:AraC-like DNA-binding protein
MKRGRVLMHRCVIAGVQATAADTALSFGRHSHDTYGVGVVGRGGQRSASGRGPVEARAGDVITVNPGEVHDGMPFDERGRAWRMLYFEPSLLQDVANELGAVGYASVAFEQPVLKDDAFAACFERTYSVATGAISPSDVDMLACETALFGLLTQCVRTHTTARAPGQGRESLTGVSASVRRARARIDDDPCNAATLAELAAEAGLSRFQFLREFARDTGLPPHAYLIQRRLALAHRLIARGAVLADAAAGAGFADQSHMTRAFVRAFGVTPAQYAAAVR